VLFRSPAALQAVEAVRRHVPEATVGAGTLLCAADVQRALDAGAQFGVTPGLVPDLAQAAVRLQLPLLPGVWTASEVMQAMAWGFEALKLFPGQRLAGRAADRAPAGRVPARALLPHGGHQARAHSPVPGLAQLPDGGGQLGHSAGAGGSARLPRHHRTGPAGGVLPDRARGMSDMHSGPRPTLTAPQGRASGR